MKTMWFFMCLCMSLTFHSYAQNVDIPDPIFKQYLLSNSAINTNGDSFIEEAEASNFGALIAIDSLGITDLTGIEAFTNLFSLSAKGNQFTSIDLSKNTRLTYANLANNQLTEIDVSNNPLLNILYLSNNQITSLDLSQNAKLDRLSINDNPIAELDVSDVEELFLLYFDDTNISDIDLTKNLVLNELKCRRNGITELDVSQNTKLERLWIDDNEITELDLTNNSELYFLTMSNNPVTNLDLSQNTKLEIFNAYSNLFTSLDFSQNTALRELRISNNSLEVLDVHNNTTLEVVIANGNEIKSLDFSSNSVLRTLYCTLNDLDYLNIANGNNINLETMRAFFNPNLFCIIIDEDFDLNNIPERWEKDAHAEYNGNCCSASAFETTETICDGEALTLPSGEVFTETGTYNYTLTNVGGCDSLVTLNLEVSTVDISVNQDGNILSAIATDATFQWLDCDNDNAVIDGATEQIFNPASNGSYAVLVSQNGCLDVSTCYDVMAVGTDDFIESNLKIFPNPTAGDLRIDLGENYEDVVISIYTAIGQLVSKTTYNTINLVDIKLVHSGVYFIEVQTAVGILANTKVIKY